MSQTWAYDVAGMALTLTQLETFVRLAQIGNFTRTAEELYLTQPAVTQQVRALAEHFDTPLFDMIARKPVLTDAGAFLAREAQTVLAGVAALERDMRSFADARSGTLELGASVTIGNYAVLAQIASFRAAHPHAVVRLEVANTQRMVEAIVSLRLGLALVEGPVDDVRVEERPYAHDRLRLIVPARGHRLSGSASLGARDISDEPFIVREAGSGTRTLAESALAAHGVAPPVAFTLSSSEGVVRAVEAGLGVAIVSQLVVERAVDAGRVHAVDIADVDLRRTFRVLSLRGRTLAPLARHFIASIGADGPIS